VISLGSGNIGVLPAPRFDPLKIIGMTFLRDRETDGSIHRARIKERLPPDKDDDGEWQYIVELGDGTRTDVMGYNHLVTHLEKEIERDLTKEWNDERLWTYTSIGGHKKIEGSWQVLVNWEDGSATWEPLSIIAKDDPVTIAAYANENDLLEVPGWKRFRRFARNRKKMQRMLKQVRLNAMKTPPRGKKFKFGVEIPVDYEDAKRLDKENNNTLWMDATDLELAQLDEYETFDDRGKGAPIPDGYRKIRLHLIYDCKHDFRRKARMVAGGHMTETPKESTYSSVVSLKSLRCVMFIAELNELEMCAGDIGNAYLEAFTTEKVAFIAGPEFGSRCGHTLVIVKALYGLRSSGARFHDLLADTMHAMGWFPSKADADVWMKRVENHWEYVATHVNDLLYCGKDPKRFYKMLREFGFKLKPTYHLGGDFKRMKEPEAMLTWGSHTFVKKMLSKYEKMFGEPVPKRDVHAPLEPGDHPELDTSPLCDAEQTQMYWSMLGDLQWAVSLGRIDIYCATMTLGGFRSAPRVGHLKRAKHVYSFLRNYKKTSVKFQTDMPDYSNFEYMKPDWGYMYEPCNEKIADDIPVPLGNPVLMTTFVDANLLFDMVTGRPATGIIHLLNKTPVD